MNCRLLRLPGAVKQPSSTHRSTVRRLSYVTVSLLASLLGFSLPVSAEWHSRFLWYTSPLISQTSPSQSEALTQEIKSSKQHQVNQSTSQQYNQQNLVQQEGPAKATSEPARNVSGAGRSNSSSWRTTQTLTTRTIAGADGKYTNAKKSALQNPTIMTDFSQKWPDYLFILLLLLPLVWLGSLTWFVCKGLNAQNRRIRKIASELDSKKGIREILDNLIHRQILDREDLNSLADLISKQVASQSDSRLNVIQSLRYRDERLLGFQASDQAQSEALRRQSSLVEELQALQKQSDDFLVKLKDVNLGP